MRPAGFTLLPVVLAMSLIGAVAFLLNRSNALSANQIGAQSNLARARYAAEAGLQAVNYTIQGLGCGGGYPVAGTPVTDSNFAGATYSAFASSASGSPLTLTSTGTYNGASVTLTKANAYAYQPGLRVWVKQPDPGAGKDTYISKTGNQKSNGEDTQLQLDSGSALSQILLQFDLAPFPPGSRPVPYYDSTSWYRPAAILSLYQSASGSSGAFLQRLTARTWFEGTANNTDGANWSTYNGVNNWPSDGVGYDPRALATVPEDTGGWADIDITDATVAWMSGVYPNYGVWLDHNGVAKGYKFWSSDYTVDITLRPKLTVYYLLPCGAAAPS